MISSVLSPAICDAQIEMPNAQTRSPTFSLVGVNSSLNVAGRCRYLRGFEDLGHGSNYALPLLGLSGEAALAAGRERVRLRTASVRAGPLARDQVVRLQPMQGWKERSRLHLKGPPGDLLDPIGNRDAMQGFELYGLQDQQVQRATEKSCFVVFRHVI